MSNPLRYFEKIVATAARSDDHVVSYEIDDDGQYVAIDGVRVSPYGMPVEMYTLNSGWQDHVDEGGLEKARKVMHDE